jgi:hypothetical protein
MGARPDVITQIREGTGTTHKFFWTSIANPVVHARDPKVEFGCIFPAVCLNSGLWVVSHVASDDGAGGTRHFSYRYEDARSDGLGRGWLGFAKQYELDATTGIVSTDTFDHSTKTGSAYPFAGIPKQQSSSLALNNGKEFIRDSIYTYRLTLETPLKNGNSIYSVLSGKIVDDEYEFASTFTLPKLTVVNTVTPSGTSGSFNLQIDGVTYAANVGDGATTGAEVLLWGAHSVSETAGVGTSLSSFHITIGGDCAPDGSIQLNPGDSKTCTITNAALEPEAIICSVFDDGGQNASGPSDAIFVSGRRNETGLACVPGGQFGICRRWFGQCATVDSQVPAYFNVFDDEYKNTQGPSSAVYISGRQAHLGSACIAYSGTIDRCRRWFGRGVTGDGRHVFCSVFDDGYQNMTQASDAVHIPHPIPGPGFACTPGNSSPDGDCRRSFGRCFAQ